MKSQLPEVLTRAVAAHRAGNAAEAERLYKRVLRAAPNQFDALHMLGVLEASRGRHGRAHQLIVQALRIDPRSVDALNNLGNVLWTLKRYEEAAERYNEALKIEPRHVLALNNRGNAMRRFGRYGEALAAYDRALAVDANSAEVLNNRGEVLQDLQRHREALAIFARSAAIKPTFTEARFNEGQCRLLIGDFREGWPKFECRWEMDAFKSTKRDFAAPLWLGKEDITGKTVLLHTEQGLGDTIQFCRYASVVASRGARVILEVQPPLKSLLRGMQGVDLVTAKGEPLPPFDLHCPLLSLPLAFNTEIETIPANIPYILADLERVATWRERMMPASATKIGIVWAGNPNQANDHNRSIALERMRPLLDVPGVAWYGLQVGERAGDVARLPAGSIVDLSPGLSDFAETAGALTNLDLVITVDTAVAHLAGALGRRGWVMLPFAPPWQWLLDRDDSPWYPTLRLFRQPRPGDWASVVERVRAALVHWATSRGTAGPIPDSSALVR